MEDYEPNLDPQKFHQQLYKARHSPPCQESVTIQSQIMNKESHPKVRSLIQTWVGSDVHILATFRQRTFCTTPSEDPNRQAEAIEELKCAENKIELQK